MEQVTSKDGTIIAFDRMGEGPPVVLVSGGSVDRSSNAPLAALLAADLTVLNYDRRGRGPSGDTPPYAVQREVEDIDAVIAAAGGSAHLFGTSSGAALALEAAASGSAVTKLALWEPPYILDENARRPWRDQVEQYHTMLAEGRRGDAAQYFMEKVVGMPPEFVAGARSAPWWAATEALAHTLPYDATIMGDYSLPAERAARVTVPTLVIDGGGSFGFMGPAADALVEALPDGHRRTLEGQEHNVVSGRPGTGAAGVLRVRFRTTILQNDKTATGIQVPDEVVTALGAGKRPKVSVTIKGYTYRSSIATVDGRSMVGVSATVREGAAVAGGDTVDVDIELDTAPREVTVPPDFASALKREPDAKRFFEGLTFSKQRWHVESIEGAKTPETRQRRIDKSVDMLREGRAR